jgi:SAM-dependent methyltransferase
MTTPRDALALHAAGKTTDALIGLFNAIAGQPSQSPAAAEHRYTLASLLEGVTLTSGNATVFHGLLELLRDPLVDAQSVARAVLGLLSVHGAFQLLEREAANEAPVTPMALQALLGEPLVREALRRIIVTDARAERVFAFTRRALAGTAWDAVDDAWHLDAMATLAVAAESGEFAWAESADEASCVHAAMDVLSAWLASSDPVSAAPAMAGMIVRLCMYRPLSALAGADRLLQIPVNAWGNDGARTLGPLLDTQLRQPYAQRELAVSLASLTDDAQHEADHTSARVRAMYEDHPYPRWHTVAQPHLTSIPVFVRALAERHAVPDTNRVLIAGCGTGRQAAHTALSFRDADILALDLSRTSLGYAASKAQRLGLDNLTFVHGNLLQLDVLDETFALIFCSGVLHHLADPMAGWRQLVQRLHPSGVMKISLYSTIARRPVQAARALIAEQGFDASDAGIRACRQFLVALPGDHPARTVTESADFYSASGVRDLLMHVQERTYTLHEIAADLDALQLRFLGFQLPTAVRTAFTARYPKPDAARDLKAWARFEEDNPTIFWGMYQFFVEHRARR